MTKMEDILAQCLNDLEQGDCVEDCLVRYREHRDQLEPLLRAAQEVRSAPDVGPSHAFRQRARTRLLQKIQDRESVRAHCEQGRATALLDRLLSSVRAPLPLRRLAIPVVAAFTVLLLLGMLGAGAVYASSESLPGDSLYPIKLAGERLQLALSPSERSSAKLRMRFAGERLEEAAALAERDEAKKIDPLMREYVTEVEAVSALLEQQHAGGPHRTSLSRDLGRQLAEHEKALRQLQERISEDAQVAVRQALAASRTAQRRIAEPAQPAASPTSVSTLTPTPSATSESRTPTETSRPTQTPRPTKNRDSDEEPEPTDTAGPPGQTKTPEAPGHTRTAQPPGQTHTPQPPGRTKTPQPPGQTRTVQPPGQTHTPEPPGQTRTPQPPGRTHTPQPPGQTRTPQPPGLTKTPPPPGRSGTPGPP